MNERDYRIIESMEKYGGSFVKALSKCFRLADNNNYKILRESFPNYWETYEEFAIEDEKREGKNEIL